MPPAGTFPTDILAGAAIGAFAGWVVPHLHEMGADLASARPRQAPGARRFRRLLVF